jgi:hypothetical protein
LKVTYSILYTYDSRVSAEFEDLYGQLEKQFKEFEFVKEERGRVEDQVKAIILGTEKLD